MKRLGSLNPPQIITPGGGAHQAAFGVSQAVNHRKDRNRSVKGIERNLKAAKHVHRETGARRIMDQDALRRRILQRFQCQSDRLLASLPTGDKPDMRNAFQRI